MDEFELNLCSMPILGEITMHGYKIKAVSANTYNKDFRESLSNVSVWFK